MGDIQIDVNGVAQLLRNLDPQKATGPDNIPTRFLKIFTMELVPCLTLSFIGTRHSTTRFGRKPLLFPFTRREIVHHQKTIVQYLLHVSSAKHSSISSQLISTHIYLNKYNILTDHQYDFRSERSCKTQLIGTINDFAETLNDSSQIDGIFLDMSKAFDTVPLKRLCCKFSRYGICGYTLKWIKSLLTGRSQQVVVNGEYMQQPNSGVPQDSVLGSLLFLCYINDIAENLTSKVWVYADVTLIYRNNYFR